ncbi:hypothetical protein ES703_37508 [subsurface metagenome]
MRELVRIAIGEEELCRVVENGEATGFQPLSIRHLNQDILGCVTYITLIGNAMTKTMKEEVADARG